MHLTAEQIAGFEAYHALLLDWNQRMNLTAITEPEAVRVRHFLDSLSVLTLPDLPDRAQVIDIGTGAGLPGVPLAILRPAWTVHLVDATAKKIRFLEAVIAALGLPNLRAEQGRAETLGQAAAYRERYDIVLARAVARLPLLAEYMLPLCRRGGVCIAMKGDTAQAEADDARNALKTLGGTLENVKAIDLPGLDTPHYLVCLRKTSRTPATYPRPNGVMRKNPL